MKLKGFTAVELLITVLVVSILFSIAMPGLREIIQNNRAISLSTDMISAVNLAKTEAIKRGVPVSLCPAKDSTMSVCGTANDWNKGWIVFADPNANGTILNTSDKIAIQDSLMSGNNITSTITRITFSGNGFVTTGSGNLTLVASGCMGKNGRIVTITNTGRISVANTPCS